MLLLSCLPAVHARFCHCISPASFPPGKFCLTSFSLNITGIVSSLFLSFLFLTHAKFFAFLSWHLCYGILLHPQTAHFYFCIYSPLCFVCTPWIVADNNTKASSFSNSTHQEDPGSVAEPQAEAALPVFASSHTENVVGEWSPLSMRF